jgi:hypothetical protein
MAEWPWRSGEFSNEEAAMSMVLAIEQDVSRLSPEELARFREWFEEFDAMAWDRQFEADVKSGKLDGLANQAVADFRAGRYREL